MPTAPAQTSELAAAVTDDALAITDLTVAFTRDDGTPHTVLDQVSLSVPRGQFIALVGRSGGGKTTLLNTITGLLEPDAGTVRVLGREPRQARQDLGFIPARDALLPWRSAVRNVEYGLELRGFPRRQRRDVAARYLDLVGLADAADRWPWQLSQGMRQRVALARAWVLEPRLLLMDEPFAALDAQTRESVRAQFLTLLSQGEPRTVVFVTHDLEEAVILADRIVMLGGGKIIADMTVPGGTRHDADGMLDSTESIALLRTLRGLLRDDAAGEGTG
jgi:NitT/TauT family transport system ATP-binding protein